MARLGPVERLRRICLALPEATEKEAGWIGMRLGAGVDWNEVEDHVHEAYRLTAPKRLLPLL